MLSRHAIESLWPDVYRTLITGTGCDKGAQKNSCDAKKSQVQTLTVNQGKPEVNESSEVIPDKVVKQTQLVKKSGMTVTGNDHSNKTSDNNTKKSDVSKSDKK